MASPTASHPPHRGAGLRQDLRTTTMAVLFVAFVAFAAGQWISARWVYDESFGKAERRDALAQARHAQVIVTYPRDFLRRTTIDNAMWDEAYGFMRGQNPRHPDNLAAMTDSFRILRMSAFAYVSLDGRVVYARQFDARRQRLVAADPRIVRALEHDSPIARRFSVDGDASGYSRIGEAILGWTAAPILHSDGSGPVTGWWVLLSSLDERFLESTTQAIGSPATLEIRPPGGPAPAAVHVPLEEGEVAIAVRDDESIDVRFALGTMDDGGVLELVMTSPRVAHAAAVRASHVLLVTTLLLGALLTAFALRFVERRLLRRRDIEDAVLRAIPDTLLRVDRQGVVLEAHGPAMAGPGDAGTAPPGRLDLRTPALPEALARARETGEMQQFEYSEPRAHGRTGFLEARVAVIDGVDALVLLRDITERKEAEARVARLAYFDDLTDLPNRAAFMDRMAREVRRAGEGGGRLGLLFLDLDGFKQINDTMGHSCGDRVLLATAGRLREALRPADAVAHATAAEGGLPLARLGGDEFTLLVTDISGPEDLLSIASRIGAAMRHPFEVDGREFLLTSSIGIAMFPDDGDDAETLLKHADTAMYHAKRQGRDNSQLYSASLTEQAMRRLDLDNSLRSALARGEFHVLYQPVIDLATGRMASVEALIRWNHPVRGLVAPSIFIPLAEESGLISAIGDWVLRRACQDLAGWRRDGIDLRVAVNVSPRQFLRADLVAQVLDALARAGLPPQALELEITEGAVMERFAATIAALHSFRSRGIRIALDDFGTGYSSLGYLMQIPIDVLKVDRSFVGRLPGDGRSASIVRAILALAGAIGVEVTAEGVETLAQARCVQTMNCHNVQGYFFSRPVPAEQVPQLAAVDWRIALADSVTPA